MELTNDQKRAMRAFAQWKLGDRAWAWRFIRIVEAEDPIAKAESYLNGETVDGVLEGAQE